MALIEIIGTLIFCGWALHAHHDHHHHRRRDCDVDDARRRVNSARCDDETLSPGQIRHRVEEIFAHVEEARCHRAPAIANDVTTPHGRTCLGRALPRGGRHSEPRMLEGVEIAVVDDRPGDIDDALYVMVRGEEIDCHEHFTECWRLVRGRHRDWLLDDLFIGHEAAMEALLVARKNARRSPGSSSGGGGAVQKRGGGR